MKQRKVMFCILKYYAFYAICIHTFVTDTDSQEARSGGSETQSSSKPFITHFKPFTPRMNLAQDPFLSLNNENLSVDVSMTVYYYYIYM